MRRVGALLCWGRLGRRRCRDRGVGMGSAEIARVGCRAS